MKCYIIQLYRYFSSELKMLKELDSDIVVFKSLVIESLPRQFEEHRGIKSLCRCLITETLDPQTEPKDRQTHDWSISKRFVELSPSF